MLGNDIFKYHIKSMEMKMYFAGMSDTRVCTLYCQVTNVFKLLSLQIIEIL